LRCHLGLVLPVYTWTPESSSLAPKGRASSLGRQLADQEPEQSPRVGVNFWSLVDLQPLIICYDVSRGVANL
ncbi:hypothetical protein GW17_00061431, partial [Ensete ventricosum]